MQWSWTIITILLLQVSLLTCTYNEQESFEAGSQDENNKWSDQDDQTAWRNEEMNKPDAEEMEEFSAEKKKGDVADMFGSPHHSYPAEFKDLGRRFVPQYPYVEIKKSPANAKSKVPVKSQRENHEIIPVKASPEEVLKVAMESAIEQARQPENDIQDAVENEILRTGDYWNSVWVEEVDPSVLRSHPTLKDLQKATYRNYTPQLGSVKAKIMPGSKLYKLVSVLKQFSPRLLYVINKGN